MTLLTALDLMTPDVVTVPPATPVIAVARLLAERGISAVPVVDKGGKVVGVVTEADLIRRLAGEEDQPQGWLRSLFSDPGEQAERYARTHGSTAEEIMTADLKRIRPAQTAEVRFRITSPFIAQTFGNDLTAPRTRIRLIVIASARRVLSTMTGAQATGPEGPPAVMKEVDRALAGMGVTVQEFKLRYVFLSGPTP